MGFEQLSHRSANRGSHVEVFRMGLVGYVRGVGEGVVPRLLVTDRIAPRRACAPRRTGRGQSKDYYHSNSYHIVDGARGIIYDKGQSCFSYAARVSLLLRL
jgi:hypothetical protein